MKKINERWSVTLVFYSKTSVKINEVKDFGYKTTKISNKLSNRFNKYSIDKHVIFLRDNKRLFVAKFRKLSLEFQVYMVRLLQLIDACNQHSSALFQTLSSLHSSYEYQ